MVNPYECIVKEQLAEFVDDIYKALKNCGSALLIEPAKRGVREYLCKIEELANTCSSLRRVIVRKSDSVDLSQMEIVQEECRKTHYFDYAIFQRNDKELSIF